MRKRLGSKWGSAFLAVVVVALLMGMVSPAAALEPLPLTCTAAGVVNTVPGSPYDLWSVNGAGSCQGDLTGTYVLNFTGVGRSQGMGLCPAPPGDILVTNFEMIVTGTLTNLGTGVVRPLAQGWFAPLTTYPLATPFLIDASAMGDGVGAGSMFSHIFLNCQGSPVAQFTFTWLT